MKKLLLKFCIFSFFLCSSLHQVYADVLNQKLDSVANSSKQNIEYKIDGKISKELKDAIEDVYGKENVDEIYNVILDKVVASINSRPAELKQQDLLRSSDWYKNEIIYMFYVDQFGVIQQNKSNTFGDATKMLKYLKNLGVTTLYILPFADSPMKDAGFDVKNPQTVRQDLGGMKEFISFVKQAKAYGFRIKADLVLNHFSSEHEWFKRLEQGDESALKYFVYTDKEPKYRKYQDEKLGTVIEYVEDDGKVSKRRLIFPENVENNYRKVTVNGKIYYLYHTFYPFQLDINWENPEVLYYALDTITNWTNLGIDIFRMDAIPYLIKEKGTSAENLPRTHSVIKILSDYIQLTAPSSVMQVEACQQPKDILPYFGKERDVDIQINNKVKTIKRTNEAQIAYHFPYMPALWASFVTEDKKYFIDAYKNTPQIPKTAAWGMFLRVHDELTLEMVSPEVRKIVYNDLIAKGAEFRKGFGISGRLSNFLDKNPDRIEMAYSILFSLPGIPIIYYGDEVGVTNNFENAKISALLRSKNKIANLLSVFDSRDINRGKVSAKLFYGSSLGYYKYNSQVYNRVSNLINIRKSLPVMRNGDFELLTTKSKSNFAYLRKNKTQQILVINNLSKEKLCADITLPIDIIVKNEGNIVKLKNLINGDNIKVNISLKNRTMHLRLAPYQTLWLDITPN